MANASIHLAIAKKYLEKHVSINKKDFLRGTIYPDAAKNEDATHYTDMSRKKDLISHLQGKVVLKDFLEEHQNMSDFELGWFLHLIVDYRFFHECFDKNYLKNTTYQEFCNRLYHTYDNLNDYIYEKYKISISDFFEYKKEWFPGKDYADSLLTNEKVDAFIESVANISLDRYIIDIQNNKYI